jgi:hypothetical protein
MAGFAAVVISGVISPAGVAAPPEGGPDVIGQWSEPFEEGGAATPRCRPADDGTAERSEASPEDGWVVCKPSAVEAAVLNDGRVFYFNGLESQENARVASVPSLPPSSRNSQARILDVRSGTPRWIVPTPGRGSHTNPNIKRGHKSYDDPLGAAGIPGRPGDGFVGSTWGSLGGPPHDPTSSPDDPSPNDGDMFCADLTALPNGKILIAGGTDWYNEPSVMDRNQGDPADVGFGEVEGIRSASLFDPASDTFQPAAPMKYGRWYPHLVIGPDGNAWVFGGVTRLLHNTQLGNVRRVETYHGGTDTWEEQYVDAASEAELPLVPRMILTPNGQFFYTAVGQMWGPFGQAVDEALMSLFQFFDPKTKKWSVSGVAPYGARSGAFVLPLTMTPPYDRMTIMTWGGTLGPPPGSWLPANPFTTLTTVDSNGNVSNRSGKDLNHARWYSSGVLLPDGRVLAVGGGDKDDVIDPGTTIAVKIPELYDPATDKWTDVAPHTRDRAYHNSALLLPDMRVLLGGNAPLAAHYAGPNQDQGRPFANNDSDPSFEIWSPPYLFRGSRPTVTRVQKGVGYGETFAITTPDAGLIESVLLMRTPSPEHVADSDQRALQLEFTRSGATTLTATAPPSGTVAPPGTYYLVVNKRSLQGPIPSVARMVDVGRTDLSDAPQPYPDDPPAPSGGSATADEDTSVLTSTMAQVKPATAAARQRAGDVMKNPPAPAATLVRRWLFVPR